MKPFRILFLSSILSALLLAAAQPASALNPNQPRPDGVAAAMTPSLNAFWSQKLAESGKSYVPPTAVHWYTKPTPSACGLLLPGNSYFCSLGADRRLYLDWAWHFRLIARFGDYGSGYVLAHEWAHHVQDQLGWMAWADNRGYFAGKELQADCYAGIYTRHAYDTRVATADDYYEARAWLSQFGDDFHWRHPYAHGRPWLRQAMFKYGFDNRSLAGCDLVYANIYRPGADDRSAPPKKPAKAKKKTKKAKKAKKPRHAHR